MASPAVPPRAPGPPAGTAGSAGSAGDGEAIAREWYRQAAGDAGDAAGEPAAGGLPPSWPLRDFAQCACGRAAGAVLRFLHFYAVRRRRRPSAPEHSVDARGGRRRAVLLCLPPCAPPPPPREDDGADAAPPPEHWEDAQLRAACARFTDAVRAACALLDLELRLTTTPRANDGGNDDDDGGGGGSDDTAPTTTPGAAAETETDPPSGRSADSVVAVVLGFCPWPDAAHVAGLAHVARAERRRARRLPPPSRDGGGGVGVPGPAVVVLCGDCEALGMPASREEEDQRSLDGLRVDMLLRRELREGDGWESEAPIAVEYARGGRDAARAREENCALRRHQRAQLVGADQDFFLLSERWQVFTPRRGGGGGGAAAAAPTAAVMAPAPPSAPSAASVGRLRRKLLGWMDGKLAAWDAGGGGGGGDDDKGTAEAPGGARALRRKHGSRDAYAAFLMGRAEKRFAQQVGPGATLMMVVGDEGRPHLSGTVL